MRFRIAFGAFAFTVLLLTSSTTGWGSTRSTQLSMTATPAAMKAQDARDIARIEQQQLIAYLQAQATTTTTTEPPSTTTTTTTTPPVQQHEMPATPAPAEDPAAAPSGSGSVEDAIAAWFGDIYQQAWNVSGCESTHNPDAISPGGGNYGLFQINKVHADEFEAVTGVSFSSGWSNAYYNAQYARTLYNESGGWGPWSCKWAA